MRRPGHPIEGENWRPQLAPYKPWVHDAALDETEELDGTDGDLLIVGALGMGISDEERMGIMAVLCAGKRGRGQLQAQSDRPSESRLLTLAQQRRQRRRASCPPHELWTLGQRRAGIRKRKRRIRLAKMRTKLKSVKHRKTVKHF